jgi:flavin-dependent dehydrogenase
MTNPAVDIIVIGAGPAGSATAMYAARAGYSVSLLERRSFPRETLCGEFLSHEVMGILGELELEEKFHSLEPRRLDRFTLLGDHGLRLTRPLGFTGFGMRRSRFDGMLLDAARSRGVRVIQPAEVESVSRLKDGFEVAFGTPEGVKTIQGKWVIGAYGKSSRLDRLLGRSFARVRTGLNGVKFHVPVSALGALRDDEILICAGDGIYCGVNPIDGDVATICYLDQRSRHNANPRERLRELVGTNPVFARIVTQEALDILETATIYGTGNIFFGARDLVDNGVMMVGDAARVIAPLAGDGIGMALQGGRLLGRLLEEEYRKSRGPDALARRYRREWDGLFLTRVRTALMLQRTLLSPFLRRVAGPTLGMFPGLLQACLEMTRERLGRQRAGGNG